MASMVSENLGGIGGSKTCLLFFNQPKGVVTTTSLNLKVRPLSVEIEMVPEEDLMWVTLVESLMLAPASAGVAILQRISLYVPAANKFSRTSVNLSFEKFRKKGSWLSFFKINVSPSSRDNGRGA